MVKIAFVINFITNNGPSRVVLDIINNLDCNSYSIALITLFDGNDESVVRKLRNEGFTVYECKTLSRIKCMLGMVNEFENLISKKQFDIIHTHGFIPDLLASRLKGKTKTISTLHNNMFEDYVNQYGEFKSKIFTNIHLKALQNIDKKVCCSASVHEIMKKYLDNITFIRNGIEPLKTNTQITRKQIGIPDNAKVYIFAGGLITGKNVTFLIREFVKHHLENEFLIILGDGKQRSECQALADDHVKMCGFQPDSVSFFNISDIYVSASKSEGFSIAVLEALFCGLGLFLSDIPSHREVVEMQNSIKLGELFEADNFAEKLDDVRKIELNKCKIQSFALDNLSSIRMASKYEVEYQSLVGGQST